MNIAVLHPVKINPLLCMWAALFVSGAELAAAAAPRWDEWGALLRRCFLLRSLRDIFLTNHKWLCWPHSSTNVQILMKHYHMLISRGLPVEDLCMNQGTGSSAALLSCIPIRHATSRRFFLSNNSAALPPTEGHGKIIQIYVEKTRLSWISPWQHKSFTPLPP